MKTLEFTHANTKKRVCVQREMIFSWWHSDAQKCTLVMAGGGAIVPVSESVDEVESVVNNSHGGESK